MKDNISITIRGGKVYLKIWTHDTIAVMARCKSIRQALHMAEEYYEHFVPIIPQNLSLAYWEDVGAAL